MCTQSLYTSPPTSHHHYLPPPFPSRLHIRTGVPEHIEIHGTLYPVSPDYVAVYVVDFSRGTPNPLTIVCNGTTSWGNDIGISFGGEPFFFGKDYVFGEGNNLMFQGFNSRFIGTYSCADGSIRIYVTNGKFARMLST